MTNPQIPPVPLRLVAPYLRAGDRVLHDGNSVTLDFGCSNGNWFGNGDTYLLVPDSPITLISPRIVPVVVGETIKAGEPYAACCDGQWCSFKPNGHDEEVYFPGLFRLVRDEAPRTATRADVREGMRVRFFNIDDIHEGLVTSSDDRGFAIPEEGWFSKHGRCACQPVEILSESAPETAQPTPAEAVATPQPDHSVLREAWRFLVERTPWGTMAEIHASRGWGGSRWSLPLVAEELFQQVLLHGDPYRRDSAHMLVVLTDNPDRPVELYSEALNSAAYHAKRDEIWPSVKAEPRQSYECKRCHSMNMVGLTAGHGLCGDCVAMDRWPNKPPVGADPPRKLPLAVAYHLSDEPGCTGLPEHN